MGGSAEGWGGNLGFPPPFFGGFFPPPNLLRVLFFQGNILKQSLYGPLPPGRGSQGAGLPGEGPKRGGAVWGLGEGSPGTLWELTRSFRTLSLGCYSGVTRGLLRGFGVSWEVPLQCWFHFTPGLLRLYSEADLCSLRDYSMITLGLLRLYSKPDLGSLEGHSRVT